MADVPEDASRGQLLDVLRRRDLSERGNTQRQARHADDDGHGDDGRTGPDREMPDLA